MKFSLELELIFLLHSTGKTTKPTLTEFENIALATKMDESCVFRLGQTRAYTDKILFAGTAASNIKPGCPFYMKARLLSFFVLSAV